MDEEPMDVNIVPKKKAKKKKNKKKLAAPQASVYIPGQGQIDEDEELIADESAYVMLHQATTGGLRFDTEYPS